MMLTAPTPAEAKILVEREVVRRAGTCIGVRCFPYPCLDRRSVILSCELSSGDEIQVLTRLAWPIAISADGHFDESAIARAFAEPTLTVN